MLGRGLTVPPFKLLFPNLGSISHAQLINTSKAPDETARSSDPHHHESHHHPSPQPKPSMKNKNPSMQPTIHITQRSIYTPHHHTPNEIPTSILFYPLRYPLTPPTVLSLPLVPIPRNLTSYAPSPSTVLFEIPPLMRPPLLTIPIPLQ